jgi:hypothetical protein
VVASHPERVTQPFVVAPTTDDRVNTLELDLIAVACLSLLDAVFEFNSSFPTPDMAVMLQELPGLREKHKNRAGQLPPISVFGHADPAGDDVYNKQLSGRRAKAIFGLLTHDLAVWEALFQKEWFEKNAIRTMSGATGLPSTTPRKQLMQEYMSTLFPEKLTKSDFLAQGADPKGRGDLQGCSEFNPLIVLSENDNKTLPREQRNARNRLNRRVLVFLFRPGVRVTPGFWPCPAADDPSIAACQARFFGPPKTGEERRSSGAQRREFAITQDTFACRFYARVSDSSPCESPGVPLTTITIRLFNVHHEPMVGAKYVLEVGGRTFSAETNDAGILSHRVPLGVTTGKLTLDMWSADLVISPIAGPDDATGRQVRLENLGYVDEVAGERAGAGGTVPADLALMRFQSANELPPDGQVSDDTTKKLLEVYGS